MGTALGYLIEKEMLNTLLHVIGAVIFLVGVLLPEHHRRV